MIKTIILPFNNLPDDVIYVSPSDSIELELAVRRLENQQALRDYADNLKKLPSGIKKVFILPMNSDRSLLRQVLPLRTRTFTTNIAQFKAKIDTTFQEI